MKHIRVFAGIGMVCLLWLLVACTSSPAPADTQPNPAESDMDTISASEPETLEESETQPVSESTLDPETIIETENVGTPDKFIIYGTSEFHTCLYKDLCSGEFGPAIYSTLEEPPFGFSLVLTAPLIYADVGRELPIATAGNPGWVDFDPVQAQDLDITWSIAEPELLEVTVLDKNKFRGSWWTEVPSVEEVGMVVRTLSPGVAHLYITVTHRETGENFTLQQIVVVRE